MRARWIAAVPAILLAACSTAPQPGGLDDDPPDGTTIYEATATVLEDASHGPQLCLGGILTSLPPQCGGPPITNWDWSLVEKEVAGGTTWGDYHVVGTFDGTSFTLAEPPGPPQRSEPEDPRDRFATPCPEPERGWRVIDSSRIGYPEIDAAMEAARRAPDHAGVWVSYPHHRQSAADTLINAAFTGDLARHERELRELWSGMLCVIEHERTLAELRRIQNELSGDEFGLQVLWVSANERLNRVDLHVVWDPGEAQEVLDARYGPGVVHLTTALTPVAR